MKTPSILCLALALAATAARGQAGGELMAVNAMENTPPPLPQGASAAGLRTLHDLLHNRDFLVNDKDNTVALADYTTGQTSPFISLDKNDHPIVRSYQEYLNARRVLAVTPDGSAVLPPAASADGGGFTMRALGFAPAGAPGGGAAGSTPGAAGKGALGLPGAAGGGLGSGSDGASPQAFAAAGDGGAGIAVNPATLGASIGRMMSSMGNWGSSTAGGPAISQPGVGGAGVGAGAPPPGSALAPDSIQLTLRGTIRANERSQAVEKEVLRSGALAVPGKPVPNAGDDNAVPLGVRSTSNGR